MRLKNGLAAAVIAGAAVFTSGGQAAQLEYTFGDLLSGSGPVSANFAKLTVTTGSSASDPWSFWLHSLNLVPFFGSQSFLGAIAVDGSASNVQITGFESNSGLTKVGFQDNASGPGGTFEFRFDLTNKGEKVESGEYVKWSATGISSISSYAAHIQGIGATGEGSAWYSPGEVPAPVPLPAAFWLVASALLGFTGWRRYGKATKDVSFSQYSAT